LWGSNVRIIVPQTVKSKLSTLGDDDFLAVEFEIEKFARTRVLDKERVAVLNDRYDVYIFAASTFGVVIAHEPGSTDATLADLSNPAPTPHAAASRCAQALNIAIRSIHVIEEM
jgi:hypothetical protein